MQDYRALLHAALAYRLQDSYTFLSETSLKDLSDSVSSGSVVQQLSPEEGSKLFTEGLAELRTGSYALMILSGGQATRVGTTLPKALLPISPVRRKTLLQLHLERVKKLCDLMGTEAVQPYIFILTSSFNNSTILGYLESVRYCGLDKHHIILLQQGNTPCIRMENHELFPSYSEQDSTLHDATNSEENIIVAPNGNGALFETLAGSEKFRDILDSLKMLHVIAIDNALSRPLDPELIGLHMHLPGLDVLNKCVMRLANENLGVFCMGEVPIIVEYSELEKLKDSCFMKNPNAKVYGNICDHMFSGPFLKRVIEEELYKKLMYHAAKKVVPYYDVELQRQVIPRAPNGYKMELFIFDIFQFAKKVMCLEVDRFSHFAPVKYISDYDAANLQSVQHRMSDVAKLWLKAAGASVSDGFVDISPALSYAGEGLERYHSKKVEGPVYLE